MIGFKLVSTGQFIDGCELMTCDTLGGIIYELGHRLNLPYKTSDLPNIALILFGNHTYQKDGESKFLYLTKASCAILDVDKVFNSKDNQYYNVSPSIEIRAYSGTKDNTK